jgi:hypothetical protein
MVDSQPVAVRILEAPLEGRGIFINGEVNNVQYSQHTSVLCEVVGLKNSTKKIKMVNVGLRMGMI